LSAGEGGGYGAGMSSPARAVSVDFHFDLICPFAATFEPYLQGRDWLSINRGEVVDFTAPAACARTAAAGTEGSVA
jgi:hypothetical protein